MRGWGGTVGERRVEVYYGGGFEIVEGLGVGLDSEVGRFGQPS